MSTEIATIPTPKMAELSPEYAEILVLGNVLQKSGYFKDVRDQAQAVTKILFGRELGFSPIVSMSGIYVIEGKPALSANMLAACIKRSGKYDYRIRTWDSTKCLLMFREKVDGKWEDVGESSFTMEDAKAAKVVGKDNWSKYPKAMLFARALSQGERAYCPDVSMCALYVPEELGATVNENGEVLTAQDLPKSARPVEVTQEDIPVTPAVETTIPAVEPIKPYINQLQDKVTAKKTDEYPGCATKGMQVNFARAWKEACPKDLTAKEVEVFRHDWLARHHYVDEDGKPTSAKIPMAEFEGAKKDAVKFAHDLGRTSASEIPLDQVPF